LAPGFSGLWNRDLQTSIITQVSCNHIYQYQCKYILVIIEIIELICLTNLDLNFIV